MNLHIPLYLFELFSVTGDIDIDMDKVTNTGIDTDTDMDMNMDISKYSKYEHFCQSQTTSARCANERGRIQQCVNSIDAMQKSAANSIDAALRPALIGKAGHTVCSNKKNVQNSLSKKSSRRFLYKRRLSRMTNSIGAV